MTDHISVISSECFQTDLELFDKFIKAVRHTPGEILSKTEFEKRLNNPDIDFYRLPVDKEVFLTNGARMSGIVICRKTGKRQLIRDYFAKNVPSDYSREPKTNFATLTNSQGATPSSKRDRPSKKR